MARNSRRGLIASADCAHSENSQFSDDSFISQDVENDSEIMALHHRSKFQFSSDNAGALQTNDEDVWSCAFCDPVELFSDAQGQNMQTSYELRVSPEPGDNCPERAEQRSDLMPTNNDVRWTPVGLDKWTLKSPFIDVIVELDNVDNFLHERYVKEGICILSRLKDKIQSNRENNELPTVLSNTVGSRIDCLRCFLPNAVLEIVRSNVNRVLIFLYIWAGSRLALVSVARRHHGGRCEAARAIGNLRGSRELFIAHVRDGRGYLRSGR